jgi:hypothetical protein
MQNESIAEVESLMEAGIRTIPDFIGARTASMPKDRLEEVRKRALKFRERFLDEPEVVFYKSVDLVRAPYPSRYAYAGVFAQSNYKFPLLHLLNRLFIVQYLDFNNELRTLLFSPSDHEGNRETPFFKRLAENLSIVPKAMVEYLAPIYDDVPGALKKVGIRPEQVDYISYDHLHTQDVRKWLGSNRQPGLFPNAKLLVHEQEWESTNGLLPSQAEWYCPKGIDGIPAEKVLTFRGDIQLGRGLALMHTPGHTEGNHSLVARVLDGIRVTSENGVGVDAYAPQNSRVNEIRSYAKSTGAEVILNGNTLEGSNDQYISMVMEKTIAGPSSNPDYPNCASSSEATPYWLLPGHEVSYLIGKASFGKVRTF